MRNRLECSVVSSQMNSTASKTLKMTAVSAVETYRVSATGQRFFNPKDDVTIIFTLFAKIINVAYTEYNFTVKNFILLCKI